MCPVALKVMLMRLRMHFTRLLNSLQDMLGAKVQMKKEAEAKKDEGTSASGDAFTGSSKVAEVKPVSSIAVKRKAEEEDTSNKKLAAETETAAAS